MTMALLARAKGSKDTTAVNPHLRIQYDGGFLGDRDPTDLVEKPPVPAGGSRGAPNTASPSPNLTQLQWQSLSHSTDFPISPKANLAGAAFHLTPSPCVWVTPQERRAYTLISPNCNCICICIVFANTRVLQG